MNTIKKRLITASEEQISEEPVHHIQDLEKWIRELERKMDLVEDHSDLLLSTEEHYYRWARNKINYLI